MKLLALVVALLGLAGCSGGTCGKCVKLAPMVQLTPAQMTTATQPNAVPFGAWIEPGGDSDGGHALLDAVAAALSIVDENSGLPVECDVKINPEAEYPHPQVELVPKQPLAQVWYRLDLSAQFSAAEVEGERSVRFFPGYKPTMAEVQLCVKVGEKGGPSGTSEIVDHIFSFSFTELVSSASGSTTGLMKVSPPPTGSGTCEWGNVQSPGLSFTYICHGYAQDDTFHVSILAGLVGADGSPVLTRGGQPTFGTDLQGSETTCGTAEP